MYLYHADIHSLHPNGPDGLAEDHVALDARSCTWHCMFEGTVFVDGKLPVLVLHGYERCSHVEGLPRRLALDWTDSRPGG